MTPVAQSDLTAAPIRARHAERRAIDRRAALEVTVGGPGSLTSDEWASLFKGHPMAFADMALSAESGMDGLTFRFILVRQGGKLLLALPIFECRFDVSAMVQGQLRSVLRAAGRVATPLLRPRLLGIGLVEGEWGAVGKASDAVPSLIAEAYRCAAAEFESLATRTRAQMLVLLDMGPGELPGLCEALHARFEPVGTSPCAQLPLTFETVDEYLATLSRTTRQKVRRRHRKTSLHVRVERTTDASGHIDRIYELYRMAVERAPISLGVQRREYFARVCREVEGAHYVLYWLGDRLIAFNLLMVQGRTLLDKYFCMEPGPGRTHSLYFFSWMENIGWAISRGLSLYHAGPGAEDTKAHLGCGLVHTTTMFRHTNALAHRCLAFLSTRLIQSTHAAAEGDE
jgi:hypothetical protein